MQRRYAPVAAACLLAAGVALAYVDNEEAGKRDRIIQPRGAAGVAVTIDTREATTAGAAARRFLDDHGGEWTFRVDRRTGRHSMVQGSGVPMVPGRGNRLTTVSLAGLPMPDGVVTLETMQPLARAFIQAHADLLRPERGTLVFDRGASAIRDGGRLISLFYQWRIEGIPVEGAGVFLRLNSGNLTQFGAPHVGQTDLEPRPTLSVEDAVGLLMAHSGDGEVYRLAGAPALLIQPEDGKGTELAYRLVWRLTYTVAGRIETWEGRVDAHTGEIVGFVDTNRYARAVGGVYPRTIYDNNETTVPLPLLDLVAGGAPATTSDSGAYAYGGGSVFSGLDGSFFNTNCVGCSNPAQPGVTLNLGSGFIDFGSGGTDHIGNGLSTPADRNAFYHLNQVRRIAMKWLSNSYFAQNITTNVNIDDVCNAVYNGAVNFFRSGGGCNNTGEISDVMHHEWGHGLDINTLSGDGATGEATADAVGMSMTHDYRIGPGFHTDGTPVRCLDQSSCSRGLLSVANISSKCPVIGTLGPLGYEVHCEGEIYGQAHWDLAQALVAGQGQHTGWRTSERIFFNSLPDAGGYLAVSTFPVYDAYVNADDDDGNLSNGTPNAQAIFNAFDAHGIANTALSNSLACFRPAQPVATVTPDCDHFDISWSAVPGVDHYEVFRGEVRLDQAWFPAATVPAGTTTHTDFDVAPGVDYWYTVMAVDTAGCESTTEFPKFARLTAQPILGATALATDDIPMGNRSGFPDPGEEVDLILSLTNYGEIAADSVSGVVTSSTPGVTLIDDSAAWPQIPTGAAVASLDVLRFDTDDQQVVCGQALDFQFVPTEASGCAAEASHFQVVLGQLATSFGYDFESAQGWSVDSVHSTTTAGEWVRGDPELTNYQPEDDVSDPGTDCWFTGSNPGGDDGVDDVDGGTTILLSPAIDLSATATAELSYYRWYANSDPGVDTQDYFRVDVSEGNGKNWINLETLDYTQSAAGWTKMTFALENFINLTDEVRIQFVVSDGLFQGSFIEAAVDDVAIRTYQCDDTPACFVEPTFAGIQSAAAGSSCAETAVGWQPASSNCQNATIDYNVYRSTDPAFVPGPANLVAAGLTATSFDDSLLVPGQTYHYVVRAFDSRSGEDSNSVKLAVATPLAPDIQPPVFAGLQSVTGGASCGEVQLDWQAAQETCSTPVSYEIYRSTDPAFVPDASSLIGSSPSTTFTDAALTPGAQYTYVVRARDNTGNEESNLTRFAANSLIVDEIRAQTDFEPDNGGWSVVSPNDAGTGNWEWGDPLATAYQSEDDATPPPGVNAWITGLATGPSNNDVDGGTTTLLSAPYDLSGAVDPAVRYSRWFTNDRGASPGDPTDAFVIEISNNDGASWTPLETVGAGTPLAWVPVEVGLNGLIAPTNQMRLRFSAADLGSGSLVEAGIDDVSLVDRDQGCMGCTLPVQTVATIEVSPTGNDILIDWTGDPASATRYAIYTLAGPDFTQEILLGTTTNKSFLHTDALLSATSFSYRVSAINPCANESLLE